MDSMFYGCSSLESIDLSNFNTSSLAIMFSMFYKCSSLKSINISNFDIKFRYFIIKDYGNNV